MFALVVLVSSGCNKQERGDAEDRDNATSETKQELMAPGSVTIEQAIATMGTKAAQRVVFRAPKLVSTGLVGLLLASMSPERRAKYETFVASTGFDPATSLSAMLVYADGALGEFGTAKPTVVVGVDRAINERLVAKIEEFARKYKSDDGEDSGLSAFVLLAKIPASVQTRLAVALVSDPSDAKVGNVQSVRSGKGTIVTVLSQKALKYGYVWEGGLIVAEATTSRTLPAEQATMLLRPTLELLSSAAASKGESGPAAEARFSAGGIGATFTVTIDNEMVIETKVTPPEAKRNEVARMVGIAKAQPAMVVEEVSPPMRALTELMLKSTTFDVIDGVVNSRTTVSLEAFKTALQQLIDGRRKSRADLKTK